MRARRSRMFDKRIARAESRAGLGTQRFRRRHPEEACVRRVERFAQRLPAGRLSVVVTLLALSVLADVAALPQVDRVPVPPIRTVRGTVPGVADLPVRAALPDVMVMNDGTRVTTAKQWEVRRAEMTRTLLDYATGLMPPPPGNVRGRVIRAARVLEGAVRYRLVHLSFGPRGALGFDVAIFTPAGRGPLPVIVYPSFTPTPGAEPLPLMARPPEQGKGGDALLVPLGDQTMRRAVAGGPAAVPPPSPLATPDGFASASAAVLRRGYAIATYHYQDTGEDTIGRMADGSWAFRTTRFFPAYPGYDWGLAAGWAWGLSRAVDFLVGERDIDRTRITAIGHSRIGKAVLIAGAFDERLAVVAPAGSGAGGTGAYRFNGPAHGGREGLVDMMRKYPNWFAPNLYPFANDVERLPFDQHWFIALTAPRAFISLEGADDQNCVVHATQQAWLGAMPAYTLAGQAGRLGVNYANHRHALTDDDWAALVDFADLHLRGLKVDRRFDVFPE